MSDGQSVIDIFLQPGEYFAGDASYRVRTLLGSCVSIVLWDRARRIGAMSHFLLPAPRANANAAAADNLDARYGTDAMVLMLEDLARFGVRATDCEAKIFGGGNMFPNRPLDRPAIGQQNGEAARLMLARLAIPVASQSLYGDGHRQILFDIASGDVWARHVTGDAGSRGWDHAA